MLNRQVASLVALSLLLAVAVIACDDPKPRIGLVKADDDGLVVLYKPCHDGTEVESVGLFFTGESTGVVEDDDAIWQVSSSGAQIYRFTVGQTPEGFAEVVALGPGGVPGGTLLVKVKSETTTNSERSNSRGFGRIWCGFRETAT